MNRRFSLHTRAAVLIVTTGIVLLHGCAARQPARGISTEVDACTIGDGAAPARVVIAAQGPLRAAFAPDPRTDAEFFIHGQLYEQLVRTDCNGHIVPEVARDWSVGDDGVTWTFRLRDDVTFLDGSHVTAAIVRDGWSLRNIDTAFAAVSAPGPHELRIVFRDSVDAPRILAAPRFAVTRGAATADWPIGTGAYNLAARSREVIRLAPRDTTLPEIELRITGADARGALDAGVDAVVSADAATVDYARALPAYVATPLPWNRTYVLVGTRESAAMPEMPALLDLARNAVRGDVRAAEPTGQTARCLYRTGRAVDTAATSTRAIAYSSDDAIARGLAERIAALSWPASRAPAWVRALVRSSDRPPTVLPMQEEALNQALRTDPSLAAVVAIPRAAACLSFTNAVALLDARSHLLHRGSLGRVRVDGSGTVRFGGRR